MTSALSVHLLRLYVCFWLQRVVMQWRWSVCRHFLRSVIVPRVVIPQHRVSLLICFLLQWFTLHILSVKFQSRLIKMIVHLLSSAGRMMAFSAPHRVRSMAILNTPSMPCLRWVRFDTCFRVCAGEAWLTLKRNDVILQDALRMQRRSASHTVKSVA
jgi:hypothetical protein